MNSSNSLTTDYISKNNNNLKIGLVINPFSGLGGPLAQKGSDGLNLNDFSQENVKSLRAIQRATRFLKMVAQGFTDTQNTLISDKKSSCLPVQVEFICVDGAMGGEALHTVEQEFLELSFKCVHIQYDYSWPTNARDTKNVVQLLCEHSIDVLCFVGGDGTARDVHDVFIQNENKHTVVLGIPAGVKMHSSIFAIDPSSAGQVLSNLILGHLVSTDFAEIRDIDEEKLSKGIVNSKFYGELPTVSHHEYMQGVKQGGLEIEELVLLELAETIREKINDMGDQITNNTLFVFAPGTTTYFIAQELGFDSSLLGFDLIIDGQTRLKDANREQLDNVVKKHTGSICLLITPIGGQGHLFGRGNQQLSAESLKRIGRNNLWVLSTKSKLEQLNTRPLLLDTDDAELDLEWAGLISIITGYREQVLYRLGV